MTTLSIASDGLSVGGERLLFRRQFVLGPRPTPEFEGWQTGSIVGHYLSVHPDLNFVQVRFGQMNLILLGYLIDPAWPGRGDEEIVKHLAGQAEEPSDLFKLTEGLGGRWILIAASKDETLLFHDAAGLRQVVHCRDEAGGLWCATQAGILQELLGLQPDPEALTYFRSACYQNRFQSWWPGDATLYSGTRHLLPNHFLNLRSGEVQRYWPIEPLHKVSLPIGAERGADLLKRLMVAAAARFPLAFGITAGWDSRLLLAASRPIADQIHFFTHLHYELSRNSDDLRVPGRLLEKLGLEHHVIDCPPIGAYRKAESEEVRRFKRIYARNVSCSHEVWSAIAYAMMEQYPQGRMCVKGSVSEIVRCVHFYSRGGILEDGTPEVLAKKGYMTDGGKVNSFALNQMARWLEDARPAGEQFGCDWHTLFYWEQRMGRWQAQDQAERDIVQDVFIPYNCRLLLKTLLGVDAIYTGKYDENHLYSAMMRKLWPETLDEPFNPEKRKRSIMKVFRLIRKRAGRASWIRMNRRPKTSG